MPGLAGFTIGNINGLPEKVLATMQNLITYSTDYVRDALFCDRHVCATRSHINVTQKQPQPFFESGVYVWMDGEFYNQNGITNEFSIMMGSDPEILCSLYRRNEGFSFLKRIDGFYSAVIYDSRKKKVYLVSDRYGLRQIYWTIHNGCLCWGSEVKVMLALPSFVPNISRGAVDEFFNIGYLLEDRTWFEGVELLPTGTVLTWDIDEGTAHTQRYWWWDEIKPQTGNIDELEVSEELARLFIESVKIRSRTGERVGISLSGGLDSRALLAAMPDRGYPINAYTFGVDDCDDVSIASMAVKVKGALHHKFTLDYGNWLMPRLAGVWWTDGHANLMHMHGIAGINIVKELFQINMNGFAGDLILGGSYLKDKKILNTPNKKMVADKMHCDPVFINNFDKYSNLAKSDFYFLQNRVRRFTYGGTKLLLTSIEQRKPFHGNKLIEFIYSLKDEVRFNSRIYKKMLLNAFPSYFKDIPWQKTGLPISSSELSTKAALFKRRVEHKVYKEMSRFGLEYNNKNNYTNYPKWIRQEPSRSFFNDVLKNQNSIYQDYVDKEKVLELWNKHLQGEDHAEDLCLYITFEVWLQQIFEGKFRTNIV